MPASVLRYNTVDASHQDGSVVGEGQSVGVTWRRCRMQLLLRGDVLSIPKAPPRVTRCRRPCVRMSSAPPEPSGEEEPPVYRQRQWRRTPGTDAARGPSLRVATWNVLAQCYTRSSWFPWSPPAALKQKPRFAALLRDVTALDACLLCLQEVDEYDTFWRNSLSGLGYQSLWKQRTQQTNPKKDGVLLAWRGSLTLVAHEEVEYNDLAAQAQDKGQRERLERDCVALLTLIRHEGSGVSLCAATTHIYWDPAYADVKDAQVSYLLQRMTAFCSRHGHDGHMLIAGDFNSTPGSTAHKLLLGGGALRSVFGDAEPEYTNVTPTFCASIDYMAVSQGVHVDAVLTMPRRDELGAGLPDAFRPSDHLPLAADLTFT